MNSGDDDYSDDVGVAVAVVAAAAVAHRHEGVPVDRVDSHHFRFHHHYSRG